MDTNNYKQLLEDGQRYLRTRYDLLRLELLEKLSRIIALILVLVISIVLVLTAFVYFSFALVSWMSQYFGNPVPAFCIVGGTFLLLLALVFILRKQIFLNPLIRQLSEILFKEIPTDDANESK